ncbi:unnamed protein product [Periconia digitata]|uniref:RBR-type E3 ubiquitin transferase n=1 Tax=Periconia digitata TaxID=1303443 RepID=A0A9W4XSJ0_9PLEO|nr:unnamed protein product [Periconia digitata]
MTRMSLLREDSLARYRQTQLSGARAPGYRRNRPCDACTEELPYMALVELDCPIAQPHCYCRPCLNELFKVALADTRLFPPRCCVVIPLADCAHFLEYEVRLKYEQVSQELHNAHALYCAVPTCSTYIKSSLIIDDIGTCPECDAKTCALCKTLSHKGEKCPEDMEKQQLLALAGKHKWQRCSRCGNLVERSVGCSHMSCRCGFQFCYLCGLQMYLCKCIDTARGW